MIIRRSIASVVFVCAMFAASASANPILSINPSTATVNTGDTFTLEVQIDGVVDLFSYNFDLAFDPGILAFVGIAQGDFFPAPPPGETPSFIPGVELTAGTVSFTGDAAIGPDPVSGSGTLAIATFFALMAGTTSITFPDQLFLDANLDLDRPISFDAINSGLVEVNVSAVPDEPSAMILLVAALALTAGRCFARAS